MLLRITLFVLMGIGLLGFAATAWMDAHPGLPPTKQAAAPVKLQLLAAARTLRAGSLLRPEDLAPVEVAQSAAPPGARPDTPTTRAELFGAMVRHTMLPKEIVLPADVMRPGDHGFLAAVLEPGMRAVTVGVDAVSGTAGLIWPGDHVDILLTQSIDDPSRGPGHRIAGETVLSDVRVIAIDQQLVEGATGNGSEPQPARTVTLEVTPLQAEKVSVAAHLGTLSLTVRSIDRPEIEAGDASAAALSPAARAGQVAPGTITWDSDVSPAVVGPKKDATNANTLRVFEGESEGKEFHF